MTFRRRVEGSCGVTMIGFHRQASGYCHCCRSQTVFESTEAWLRDFYKCRKCHSIPRQRHLQHILDRHFAGWEKLAIHESSPSNTFISQYCSSYSSSEFLPDVAPGTTKDGVRCESLEHLTFADRSFDVFVTQDVLEHVFHPDVAAKEIIRVLKPGGIHVFTIPKHKRVRKCQPRAILKNGVIEYLLEAQYHGNPPVGDGPIQVTKDGPFLVTWDYGDDFEFILQDWTGCPTTTYVTRDDSLGLDGEFPEVFVTRKPV
ncbi:MAG: class I SAM-dependent methyltransferase [Reyranella sp.]|nr:class I SAM-dependent methyltransferase [Reyranella sp.]MBL6652301.1 class I SAM-dependent methyltransferase [Reyranella sp.]